MPNKKPRSRAGGFFHSLAESMERAAERERERQAAAAERHREWAANERMLRSVVEDALRDYERGTGQKYQDDFIVVHHEIPESHSNGLAWDQVRKGHLVNCPDNCRIRRHCNKCGDEVFGVGIFCGNCRS